MDSVNEKFFAEDEGRNWQSKAETEFLKSVSDNQEILNKGTKAYIPLVAGNGNTLGVIEAERSDGFNTDDLARNFSKGGTFAENIKLGLEKEYQHQGRITDELKTAEQAEKYSYSIAQRKDYIYNSNEEKHFYEHIDMGYMDDEDYNE